MGCYTQNGAMAMIDWSSGFTASYYMSIVDPITWRDIDRVEIKNGSISRTASGLRQSADISCKTYNPEREQWVRVWMTAQQGADVERTALFTGLTSCPVVSIDGRRLTYPLECYSVLKPCEDVLLPRGWFAGQGFDGAEVLIDLLSVSPAPIETNGTTAYLSQAIIAESNENHLTMAEKILAVINWRMWIDGTGTIHIGEKPTEPSALFGMSNDVVEPRITVKEDWFSCPNVFRAISGDLTAEARDESDGLLSIPTRGREVWKQETNAKYPDTESIEQYAERRLAEEQAYARSVSYSRRYNPNVNVSDIVQLHYPEQKLEGNYTVKSQTITLGHNARTSEEAFK